MKVTMIWNISLPNPLAVTQGVSTGFGPFDGVTFTLDERDHLGWYRKIEMTVHTNIPDQVAHQLKEEHGYEKAQPWFDKTLARVGPTLNRFYLAVCRTLGFPYQPLFSGADITTDHGYLIELEGELVAIVTARVGAAPLLDRVSVDRILEAFLATKENVPLELLQQARDFAIQGQLVGAVVSAHTALEVFCDEYFRDFEASTSVDAFTFKSLRASEQFIDRYFHVGLYLMERRSLKTDEPEIFRNLRQLSKLRNAAAHEGVLRIREFNQITPEQQWDCVQELVATAGWVMNWMRPSSAV